MEDERNFSPVEQWNEKEHRGIRPSLLMHHLHRPHTSTKW